MHADPSTLTRTVGEVTGISVEIQAAVLYLYPSATSCLTYTVDEEGLGEDPAMSTAASSYLPLGLSLSSCLSNVPAMFILFVGVFLK